VQAKNKSIFKATLLHCLFLLLTIPSVSQEGSLDDIFKVDYDTPLTLDLAEEEETETEPKAQKKKVKKNVFFGVKTKKGFTRSGYGKNVVIELFHVLKKYEDPPQYARDFYWYDAKKKKLINSLRIDEDIAGVLHGPYKKMLGEVVLEEGWFYKGMKHRRWVRFNRHDILQEKKYWWKGWPQESRLVHYDFKKTKLREVVPVYYEEKNGDYWAFHEDGSIAALGRYKFDQRVGLWKEYYPGRRIKREVIYPNEPFDFKFNPYISKEWDRKGNLIYDRKKFLKSHK